MWGSSLDEQLARLCLLFPFSEDTAHDILKLINSLMNTDLSLSSRAGLAFLETMAELCPMAATERPVNTRTAMAAVMICELCRLLESLFPIAAVPAKCWDIGRTLGPKACEAAEGLPIGRLAYALSKPDRSDASVTALKEWLAASCGDGFCAFSVPNNSAAGASGLQIGLLRCGEGGSSLLIDFTRRTFRLVGSQLA